jgi:hypothetical protein
MSQCYIPSLFVVDFKGALNSGEAQANSSKAFRPSRWAISANVAFSVSDNNNLPLIWALRMRFSAARYSFLSSKFLVYGSGDVSKHASPNHSRASLNLIVEPGLYLLLRFSERSCARRL